MNLQELTEKIIKQLEKIRDEIYGCGNGRDLLDRYIKEVKRNGF